MIAVGVVGVLAGGLWFHLLVAVIAGLMAWEVGRMIKPEDANAARALGGLIGIVSFVAPLLPAGIALPVLMAPGMVVLGMFDRFKGMGAVFIVFIMLAGFGLIGLRDLHGAVWMLWLASVVVATDVFGYFAGRMFGGPKFWPRVSPKKTWSGTVAGWVAAAVVGLIFVAWLGAGGQLIGISVGMSMASQMGDIGESAMKRRVGVKDSSNLIPGHGGLMDRFDGMLGAALFLALVQATVVFPPVPAG